MINTFVHSRSFLEIHTVSRPKWAESQPVFRPKRRKNHTLWGGTYPYGLYKGVPPRGGGAEQTVHNNEVSVTWHWCTFWSNQKHYPDLGSDTSSVWNFCTVFVSQTSFRGKTGGGVAKCRLFSQSRNSSPNPKSQLVRYPNLETMGNHDKQ